MQNSSRINVTFSSSVAFIIFIILLFCFSPISTQSVDDERPHIRSTIIEGRLLDAIAISEGVRTPVVGAVISVLNTDILTISDSNGRFELRNVPLEDGVIVNIDSMEANPAPDGSLYSGFRVFVPLKELPLNNLRRPFYLTRLDSESFTTVNPRETTVVESSSLGATLTIEAGTAYTDDGELYDGIIGLGLVPPDYLQYLSPDDPGRLYMITIQPPGIIFSEPAKITYPNIDGFSPGTKVSILQPSLSSAIFEAVGIGMVNNDGSLIETIEGGILRSGSCSGPRPPNPIGNPPAQDPPPCPDCCPLPIGSCASLASGNLSEEHNLVSYKSLNEDRSLKFIYNSTLADPKPIIKQVSDFSNISSGSTPRHASMSVRVAGVDKGSIYTLVQGLTITNDEEIAQAIQFDASDLSTGIYPLDATITAHYISGTTKPIIKTGDLVVNNLENSHYGSGWSIDGVSRLFAESDGDVVIVEGNGDWKHFKFRASTLTPPIAPGSNFGTALKFDGINDKNDLPSGSGNLMKTLPLTIEAWVRLEQRFEDPSLHSHVVSNVVVNSGLGTVLERGHGIGVNNYNRNSNIVITRRHGNSDSGSTNHHAREIINNVDMEPGFWYHIAVVYTTGNHKVYLNGELINDSSYPQGSLTIGSSFIRMGEINHCCIFDPSSPQFYKGDMDEVRIWNVARTQQEIQNTMSTQLSGSESGLVYYTKMDEGTGQTFADSSGGGNNGTLGHNTSITSTDPAWITYEPYDRNTQGDYVIPVTEHSVLFKNPDGTHTRRLQHGEVIHYDAQGFQTSIVHRNGNTTNYEYDGQGRLLSITDPVGLTTNLSYAGDKISGVTDPAGRTTVFQVDGSGNLVRITDPDGTFRLFSYDSDHRLISQTSKRGFLTTYQYNFAGRITGATRPDNSTISIVPQWTVSLVDPASGLGTPSNPAPYVQSGQDKATYTDGNGKVTTAKFNDFGYIIESTDPMGRKTIFDRGIRNNVYQITYPKGNIVDNTFDERHNVLTTTKRSIGATTTFTYTGDGFDQIKTITDPRNNTTTFNYDANGNLTSTVDALSNQTTMTYNSLGLQTSVTDALSNTVTFEYDPVTFNLVGTTDQLLNETIFVLDAAGNNTTMLDAEGKTTTYSYDLMNRLTDVVEPNLVVTTYGYDDAGNLITVTDARSNTTSFSYDQRDRLIGKTDPLGNSESFSYDGNGNRVSTTNRNGQTITYEYNGANELIKKTLPFNNITTYTYDNNGNLLTAIDPDSKLTMTYDSVDRIVTVSTAGSSNQPNKTLTSSYDLNGNRIGLSGWAYTYDALNRLASISTPSTTSFVYDELGRRISMLRPSGLSSTEYIYDPKSQLISISNLFNGNTISSFEYDYDSVGNRINMNSVRTGTTANSPLNYVYDEYYRLTEATNPLTSTTETFIYDMVGNRLRKTGQATDSVFNDANQLIEDDEFTYTYDNNGNMIEKINKATSESTQYVYDAENRLIQVLKPGMTASYRYDAFGRRIEKNVNGTIARYIYDGMNIHEEYSASNVFVAGFRYGPGIDDHIGRAITGAGFAYYQDGLGNVTEVLDGAGTILQAYVYDAFGNIASQTGTAFNPYYSYTGREYDAESGLYYYRARYYDPAIGRFLQEDPIGFEGGDVNLYGYVWNNPTTFVDPYGLWGLNWPDFVNPPLGPSCAAFFLVSNFRSLQVARDATMDKYYHCVAFCKVGKYCGISGLGAAIAGGYGKEFYDCHNPFTKKSCDAFDTEANRQGIAYSDKPVCCEDSCKSLLP